ncbi:MAG: SGNH/GDSL hydrolase family protein [Myxococcales bacterium]|nr:SGNH/GDSL hydrolase family protein [Myxococcales bacterium]
MSGRLAEWRGVLAFLLGVLLLVGAQYTFLHRPLVHELREKGKPKLDRFEAHPLIEPAVLRQLGWLTPARETEPASAYTRIPPEKRAGTVRVCCFGGSTTFGTEVGAEYDYPTFLQRHFDRLGRSEVEVVNFGIAGYGFHQIFLLWEHLFARFACDYTLLFPGFFHAERDISFVYSPLGDPYAMHARYVVRGDDVELVPVVGETRSERFDEYFRFIPRWRYLRYDREPPMALRTLRPRDAPPSNPFYYLDATRDEEAPATYRVLLARMAAAGAPVVLASTSETDVALSDAVGSENLSAIRRRRQRSFPYQAPRWHDGPWGNDLVARSFLYQILEGADATSPLLATSDVRWPELSAGSAGETPLADYDRVEIELDDVAIAHFTSGDPRRTSSLADEGTVSLLSIKRPGESVVESCFLPLDFALVEGMAASWSGVSGSLPPAPAPLHRLAGENIGVVEIEGLRFRRQRRLLLDAPAPADGALSLELDGRTILRAAHDGSRIELTPAGEPCRLLRATAEGWVDPASIGPSGILELVLRGEAIDARRIPFARWEMATVALPVARRPLAPQLKIPASSAIAPPR